MFGLGKLFLNNTKDIAQQFISNLPSIMGTFFTNINPVLGTLKNYFDEFTDLVRYIWGD